MGQKTPLYDNHVRLGAKIVDFSGWDMPLHYGSQLEEHHQVRRAAGMFDVSHMAVVDITGEGARRFLRSLVANNVDKLKTPGKALYTCMLNDNGGVIDDLIVYFLNEAWFRLVVNAATRVKDLQWMQGRVEDFKVQVRARPELAMIAVQGPQACEKVYTLLAPAARAAAAQLGAFQAATADGLFIGRTGYTGEDGFEIILPGDAAPSFWQRLHAAGVAPAGLGARDTLRLEAGMNLYGQDMDETTTPLESGLSWTVAWEPKDRRFVGREALENQRAQGVSRKLVGLVLEGKGVLRSHQKLRCQSGPGEVTSGSFAPTLDHSIALARVPAAAAVNERCEVEIRGKWLPARIVNYPFVRHGKSCL